MDSEKDFRIEPLPLESEFRVLSVRRRLSELSREELEEFLSEALSLMTKLAHQVKQMHDYITEKDG
jgi:hypothetical protein